MNNGFNHYFRLGMQNASSTRKKSKLSVLKFIMLKICILLAKVCIFTYPLAKLMEARCGRMILEHNRVEIYHSVKSTKNYKTSMFYAAVELIMFIAGILLILILGIILGGILYFTIGLFSKDLYSLVLILTLIPVGIAVYIFILIFNLYYNSGWYIQDQKCEEDVSLLLYNAGESMKRGGKITVFMIDFVYNLIIYSIIGIGVLFDIILFLAFTNMVVIPCIFSIGLIIILCIFIPYFYMSKSASLAAFYNDIEISTDEDLTNKLELQKEINKQNGLVLEGYNKEDILLNLFDDSKEN